MLIYVDDILITGSSKLFILNLISTLNNTFLLKVLGRLHYFFGIEARWTSTSSLHLTKTRYIQDLLAKVNMFNMNPQLSPMISSLKFSDDESTMFDYLTLYHQVVGAFVYLTFTTQNIVKIKESHTKKVNIIATMCVFHLTAMRSICSLKKQ